jgi:hypothetical protein
MIYDFLSPVISVICERSFQMLLLLTIFLHNWCAVRNHKERVGFVGRFLSCQWPKTGHRKPSKITSTLKGQLQVESFFRKQCVHTWVIIINNIARVKTGFGSRWCRDPCSTKVPRSSFSKEKPRTKHVRGNLYCHLLSTVHVWRVRASFCMAGAGHRTLLCVCMRVCMYAWKSNFYVFARGKGISLCNFYTQKGAHPLFGKPTGKLHARMR